MADRVQRELELQLPELEDLARRGLFTPDEVKGIVRRRRHFEYLINGRAPTRNDYLRYVRFELALDKLLRMRRLRLGVKRNSRRSDRASIRRAFHIFNRAVKRLRRDIELWLEYARFCQRVGSSTSLGRVFGRALQLHPNAVRLWRAAAAWEFNTNVNVSGARALMQRGIRLNPGNKELLLAYFQLELVYMVRMRERRRLLAVEADTSDPATAVASETLAVETKVSAAAAAALSASAATSKVAVVVYKSAVKAVPNDVAFRIEFLRELQRFSGTEDGQAAICASLDSDFPSSAEAQAASASCAVVYECRWREVARKPLDADALHAALVRVVDEFDTRASARASLCGELHVAKLRTLSDVLAYVRRAALPQAATDGLPDEGVRERCERDVIAAIRAASVAALRAVAPTGDNALLSVVFQFARDAGETRAALEAVRSASAARPALANALASLALSAESDFGDGDGAAPPVRETVAAVRAFPTSADAAAAVHRLVWHASQAKHPHTSFERLVRALCEARVSDGSGAAVTDALNGFALQALRACAMRCGALEAVRLARIIGDEPLFRTTPALWLGVAELACAQAPSTAALRASLRWAYRRAVDCAQATKETWLSAYDLERRFGEASAAATLLWHGSRACGVDLSVSAAARAE